MNFGNGTPTPRPEDQADGFSGIDELVDTIAASETDDPELVEELADTATIEQLLDIFIEELNEIFSAAVEVSLDGNPVRTHLELVNAGQDVVELAYALRQELVAKVANRAEEIEEQGGLLRKQVIPEGD